MSEATMRPAQADPKAAPSTPRPAPGMVTWCPHKLTVRVGKIRKKLNTTSSRHISTLSRLGTRILPLHLSIALATKSIINRGTNSMNVPK